MTNKTTESSIETFAIELLVKHGYHYIYGPGVAPESENESIHPSGGRGFFGSSTGEINYDI